MTRLCVYVFTFSFVSFTSQEGCDYASSDSQRAWSEGRALNEITNLQGRRAVFGEVHKVGTSCPPDGSPRLYLSQLSIKVVFHTCRIQQFRVQT